MNVKDLQAKQGNVNLELDIVQKGDVREFQKFGKPGRVVNATAKDETGEIKLTLWNEDIDKINTGDKVKLTNGYVSEWQGELQISTGKFGTLEVIGKADSASPGATPAADVQGDEKPIKDEEDVI